MCESALGRAACGPAPEEIAAAYNRAGFAVCDGFVSRADAAALRALLLGLGLKAGSEVFPEGQHATMSHAARGDRVVFINNARDPPAVVDLCDRVDAVVGRLQGEVPALREWGFIRSAQASHYAPGGHCIPHVDNPNRNGRKLTVLMYFNGEHTAADGGHLRLHLAKAAGGLEPGPVDIAPLAGRLVFFPLRTPEPPASSSRAPTASRDAWYHDADEAQAHGASSRQAQPLARLASRARVCARARQRAADATLFVVGGVGKHQRLRSSGIGSSDDLRALAADAARELDVLRHDRDALGVDRAQVRVLEEADEVRLRGLLEREHGRALEAEVRLEVLRDLAHEALERELADEELRRLLQRRTPRSATVPGR